MCIIANASIRRLGELTPVKAGSVATAQFQADKVSGIAGCNNFSSLYKVDGKQLTFSPAAATRKMCAEPPGIMGQEDAYLAALNQVQTFKISGSSLEMQAANGDTLLEFIPAGQ
jgi:heat shock protein HslJ